jgi:hypothetical protein
VTLWLYREVTISALAWALLVATVVLAYRALRPRREADDEPLHPGSLDASGSADPPSRLVTIREARESVLRAAAVAEEERRLAYSDPHPGSLPQ